jgi:ankyrin repeat protein
MNTCALTNNEINLTNFNNYVLVKSKSEFYFIDISSQDGRRLFTFDKCPITGNKGDFLIVNLALLAHETQIINEITICSSKRKFNNLFRKIIELKNNTTKSANELFKLSNKRLHEELNNEIINYGSFKLDNILYKDEYNINLPLLRTTFRLQFQIIAQHNIYILERSTSISEYSRSINNMYLLAAYLDIFRCNNDFYNIDKTLDIFMKTGFSKMRFASFCKNIGCQFTLTLNKENNLTIDRKYNSTSSDIITYMKNFNYDAVKDLVKNGADIYFHNSKGETLLSLALKHQDQDMLDFISPFYDLSLIPKRLDVLDEIIFRAIEFHKNKLVLKIASLKKKYKISNYSTDNRGYNMLVSAIYANNIELFNILIKIKFDFEKRLANNFSALHHCILACNLEMLKILLDKGADLYRTTNNKLSVIEIALQTKNPQIIHFVFNSCSYYKLYDHFASKWFNKNLLTQSEDVVIAIMNSEIGISKFSVQGKIAIAMKRNSIKIFEEVINLEILKMGKNSCKNLIRKIIKREQIELLNDIITKSDKYILAAHNTTILSIALQNNNKKVIDYFEYSYDLRKLPKNTNTLDKMIVKAIDLDRVTLASKLISLKQNYNMNLYNKYNGNNIFGSTIIRGNIQLFNFLLELGFDYNKPMQDGSSPLHLCIYTSNLDMVKILLDKNLNLNGINNSGHSIIHAAILSNDISIIDLVCNLEYGAEIKESINNKNFYEILQNQKEDALIIILQSKLCNNGYISIDHILDIALNNNYTDLLDFIFSQEKMIKKTHLEKRSILDKILNKNDSNIINLLIMKGVFFLGGVINHIKDIQNSEQKWNKLRELAISKTRTKNIFVPASQILHDGTFAIKLAISNENWQFVKDHSEKAAVNKDLHIFFTKKYKKRKYSENKENKTPRKHQKAAKKL